MAGRPRTKLSDKQKRFVLEYVKDFNATQAAIRAKYSKKTAQRIGSENLAKPLVAEAIRKQAQKVAEKATIDAAGVLERAVRIFDRCMQAEPVMEKIDGEWVRTGEFKFEHSGANKALEIIGKHKAVDAFVRNDQAPVMPASGEWTLKVVHMTKDDYENELRPPIEHKP